MKMFMKAVAATAVLAMSAAGAVAQTVPTQPAPGPVPTGLIDGNGGLVVVIWDSVRNVSLTQYLGLTLSQIIPGPTTNMEQAGFQLDFGVLGNYSSLFGASSASNVQYLVVATDPTGGTFAGRNIATTSILGGIYTPTSNQRVRDAAAAVRNFLSFENGCNAQTPCIATSNLEGNWAGGTNMGTNLGSQLSQSSAGTAGNALGFYLLTTVTNLAVGPASIAVVDVYQSASGAFAQWLLGTDGRLVYSVPGTVVPLPAALWLLLSGLVGVGTIGRRRLAASA